MICTCKKFSISSIPTASVNVQWNKALASRTGLPVYSIVIYLVKQKSIIDPPYEMKLPTGFTVHCFFFENIKLWEIPPEVLKQKNLPGLLPLLPLTKDGDRREVVEDMIESLQQAGKADLLPLGYALSALIFKGEGEEQWLKERFTIMEDILEESWAYQEMVQKGMVKGLEQGVKQGLQQGLQALRTTLIRFVETHFPDQVSLAKQQAGLLTTQAQLQEMLDKLFVARTGDEARKMLLDLPQ
jgi:hypothetical protein